MVETPKRGIVTYQTCKFQPLLPLRRAVPNNCLCCPVDEIPGIVEGHLVKGAARLLSMQADKADDRILVPTEKLYIGNCVLRVPSVLEMRVIQGVREAYGADSVEVTVGDRRLNVGAHNGWGLVNTSKLKNSITLSGENDTLRCNGTLMVDNVFVSKGMALIFVLEYTLRLSRRGLSEEYRAIVLADLAFALSLDERRLQFRKESVKTTMNTDLDQSVTGSPIWLPAESLQGGDWKIQIECEISDKERQSVPQKVNQETGVSREFPSSSVSASAAPAADSSASEAGIREREERLERERQLREKQYDERKRELEQREHDLENRGRLANEARPADQQSGKDPTGKKETSREIERPVLQPAGREMREVDIRADVEDKYKANTVSFIFQGFEIKGNMLKGTAAVPESVCFAFKFFTFPTSYTQAVSLALENKDTGTHDCYYAMKLAAEVKKWTNVTSQSSSSDPLKVQFDVDPSLDADAPQEVQVLDFLNYLAYNTMRIWLWNADGLTPIGSARVGLQSLMRRGAQIQRVDKEIEVVGEEGETVGTLHLLVENVGRSVGEVRRKVMDGTLTMTKSPQKGKTKVYSKPLTMAEFGKVSELSSGAGEEEKRKMDMVYNYRLHMSIAGGRRGMWLQEGIQSDVDKYRAVSRTINLSTILHRMDSESTRYPSVYYSLGQLTVFPVLLLNPEKQGNVYSLRVDDPGQEVRLVTQPEEWKYYAAQENYDAPPDWGMLATPDKVALQAGEQVLLLFKVHPMSPPKTGERVITITAKDVTTGNVALQKEISLKYRDTYYNAYYVLNMPENRIVDIPLVADLPADVYKYAHAVRCSDPKVEVKLTEDRLAANFVAPASPADSELFFFLYSDEYCYKMLSAVCVQLRTHTCIDIAGIAGKRLDQHLDFTSIGGVLFTR